MTITAIKQPTTARKMASSQYMQTPYEKPLAELPKDLERENRGGKQNGGDSNAEGQEYQAGIFRQ